MVEENLNQVIDSGGATAQSLSVPQNGESESTYVFRLQATGEEVLTNPVYRLVIDVSGGKSVGRLQLGYYIKVNDMICFVVKKAVNVSRPDEAEKVFAFLAKTKLPFSTSIWCPETLSGNQYVLINVGHDSMFYSLREYKVFRGLWRVIEGKLYSEDLHPPSLDRFTGEKLRSVERFTGEKLDWYVKLMPEYPLKLKQVSNVSVAYVTSQGHLNIYKISKTQPLPGYLYSVRKKFTFFNHVIDKTVDVIPLGPQRRIVSLSGETEITSPEHDTVTLPQGEYLFIHPSPRNAVD